MDFCLFCWCQWKCQVAIKKATDDDVKSIITRSTTPDNISEGNRKRLKVIICQDRNHNCAVGHEIRCPRVAAQDSETKVADKRLKIAAEKDIVCGKGAVLDAEVGEMAKSFRDTEKDL
jgi:hypothetical protein